MILKAGKYRFKNIITNTISEVALEINFQSNFVMSMPGHTLQGIFNCSKLTIE